MKNPKINQLGKLGVDSMFAQYIIEFQKLNSLNKLEMLLLMQRVQSWILDNHSLDLEEEE